MQQLDNLFRIDISQEDSTEDLLHLNNAFLDYLAQINSQIRELSNRLNAEESIQDAFILNDPKGSQKLRKIIDDIAKPFFEASRNNEEDLNAWIDDNIPKEFIKKVINRFSGLNPYINILFIDAMQTVDLQVEVVDQGWKELIEKNPTMDFSEAIRIEWTEMVDMIIESIIEILFEDYSSLSKEMLSILPSDTPSKKAGKISEDLKKAYKAALNNVRFIIKQDLSQTGKVMSMENIIEILLENAIREFNSISSFQINIGFIPKGIVNQLLALEKWTQKVRQRFINKAEQYFLDIFTNKKGLSMEGQELSVILNTLLINPDNLDTTLLRESIELERLKLSNLTLSFFGEEVVKEHFIQFINLLTQIFLHFYFNEQSELKHLFHNIKRDLERLLMQDPQLLRQYNTNELYDLNKRKDEILLVFERVKTTKEKIDRPQLNSELEKIKERILILSNPESLIMDLIVKALKQSGIFKDQNEILESLEKIGFYAEV